VREVRDDQGVVVRVRVNVQRTLNEVQHHGRHARRRPEDVITLREAEGHRRLARGPEEQREEPEVHEVQALREDHVGHLFGQVFRVPGDESH
jgi:hypothetical protein